MLRTRTIRGLETGWIEEGEGEPGSPILFFIHGFPDSPEVWSAQIRHFSRTHRVVAPFLRGASPSEPARKRSRYGLESVALDHLEILREASGGQERPVCVIAHDIGGIHAWHLARILGKRLSRLILINAPDLRQMARKLRVPKQAVRSWYFGLFVMPKAPELLFRLAGPRALGGKENADRARFLVNHYREALRSSLGLLRGVPTESVDAPTLVLWGKDDPYLLPPSLDELKGLASHPTVRVIEGGHWLQRNEAEKVNQLIDRFIESKSERTQ